MHSARRFTARRLPSRHSARRRRSTALGWVLLVIGLAVVIWRLRVDLGPRPPVAVIQVVPVTRQLSQRPTVTPSPLAEATISLAVTEMPMQGGPRLTASQVNAILAAYGSPLRGRGQDLVALSRRYQVDDAVALAFFVMESRAGTRGEALFTHNIGNLRPTSGADATFTYSTYANWIDGVDAWFQLMHRVYLDKLKLATVEAVVPVYAPAYDGNDPVSMTAGIRQLVQCWRGTVTACPNDPPGIGALVMAESTPLPHGKRG